MDRQTDRGVTPWQGFWQHQRDSLEGSLKRIRAHAGELELSFFIAL